MLQTELSPLPSEGLWILKREKIFVCQLSVYFCWKPLWNWIWLFKKMLCFHVFFSLYHQINFAGIICRHRKGYNKQTPKKSNAWFCRLVIVIIWQAYTELKTSYGPGYARILIDLISFGSLTILRYMHIFISWDTWNAFPNGFIATPCHADNQTHASKEQNFSVTIDDSPGSLIRTGECY